MKVYAAAIELIKSKAIILYQACKLSKLKSVNKWSTKICLQSKHIRWFYIHAAS